MLDYNISYRKKDKSIQCIISYKDNNGKWKQKSKQGFRTQKESKPWATKTIEELRNTNEIIDPTLREITFKELSDTYISHKTLYNVYSTVRNMRFAFNKFKDLDDMEITEIKSLHIQDCVDDMVKEGLKSDSIKTYLSMVKSLFNYAIHPNKIIKDNPCEHIKIPTDKRSDKMKALTKSELNTLLSRIKRRDYYIASLIAGTCGLRLGEIMGLTWDDVDFKEMILTVNKQWKRLGSNNWGYGPVKQKNSNRIVPIPPHTKRELEKYKTNSVTDMHNRIIVARSVTTLSTTLIRNYNRAGFDITVHDLRHTYATLLIANGIDFKTAAKLLGHDVEMTMRTYSHVTDDMLDNAKNKINIIF